MKERERESETKNAMKIHKRKRTARGRRGENASWHERVKWGKV